MSVKTVAVQAECPRVIVRVLRIHRGMKKRLGPDALRCVDWLIDTYRQVIIDQPNIKLNAAKGCVAKIRSEYVGEPVDGVTSDDWSQAYNYVDKLFVRLFKPGESSFDAHYVNRRRRAA